MDIATSEEEVAEDEVDILKLGLLFKKQMKTKKARLNIGATICIENFEYEKEKQLYDIFSCYGEIIAWPKITRDVDGTCVALISYHSFQASDAAIEALDGKLFGNRQIRVLPYYGYDYDADKAFAAPTQPPSPPEEMDGVEYKANYIRFQIHEGAAHTHLRPCLVCGI